MGSTSLNIAAVPHVFRSSFLDWAAETAEQTSPARVAVFTVLAHTVTQLRRGDLKRAVNSSAAAA